MAKTFYTQDEVVKKLELSVEQVKDLVRTGKLREFRDGGKVTYKVADVDKMAAGTSAPPPGNSGRTDMSGLSGSLGALDMLGTGELTLDDSASMSGSLGMDLRLADDDDDAQKTKPGARVSKKPDFSGTDALSLAADDAGAGTGTKGGSGTGELVLEPADDDTGSNIRLTGSDADAISLEDTTAQSSEQDDKEGTVVTSIGVSVFDDDNVDPLAKTVVATGSSPGSLGVDAVGSGSGLLDLTRESDDTSLGAELLDEIYPGEEGSGSGFGEMGDATRAGLSEAIPEGPTVAAAPGGAAVATLERPAAASRVITRAQVEFAPDAISTGLTGVLFVGVLVMVLAGLAAASAVQGVWPSILEVMAANSLIVGGAALVAAGVAMGVGYFLGKRNNG
jgi:hypothetical protein